MKKYVIILLMLGMFGCESGSETTYIIANESSHAIEIRLFEKKINDQVELTETIILNENGDSWQEKISTSMGDVPAIAILLNADSAIVDFDNSRRLVAIAHDFSKRNVLNDSFYKVLSSSEKKRTTYRTLKFTFTNEDYKIAEEIAD